MIVIKGKIMDDFSKSKIDVKNRKKGDSPLFTVVCTSLLVEKSPQALPLGAACIASAIKNDNYLNEKCIVNLVSFSLEDEELVDLLGDKQKAAYILKKLRGLSPSFVLFSLFVWNRNIFEIVSKELIKDSIICIAGGPEVTANPSSFDSYHYLISGEGERSVPKLLRNLISGEETVPSKSKVIVSSICEDFSFSPYLDKTLNPSEYGGVLWELSRGCPFKCSYCYESKGTDKIRQIPIERLEKELDLFAKKNVAQVFVLDPTYNANKKRALDLLSLIKKKTPNTFYYFEARAEFIDNELAEAFTKIPCALQIGLQSVNEIALKNVNRSFDKKKFVRNINILNNKGVVFGLDLIYGLPGESYKSFKDGIDFALSLYPNNLEIFCLSVLPGTDLYDRAQNLNLKFMENPPYHILKTDLFTSNDLKEAEKLAISCNIFYNEGRSVPWFMSICNALKIKPSDFLFQFSLYLGKKDEYLKNKKLIDSHKKIESIQIQFLKEMLHKKNLNDLEFVMIDLIKFNGALSRTQETGNGEEVKLHYNSEYLASEYSTNLQLFVKNVKMKPCTIKTFKKNGFADWK